MVLNKSLDYIILRNQKHRLEMRKSYIRKTQYIQSDDKWVFNSEQNVFLVLDMFDLFQSDDLSDRKHLQSKVLETRLMTDQNDSTKSTRTCR